MISAHSCSKTKIPGKERMAISSLDSIRKHQDLVVSMLKALLSPEADE